MEIINVQQGSAEWLAVRAKYFTASEAAAAMGLSKYMARDQLLRQKSSGILEEVDAQKQRLFDQGHASEAAARPIVEARIGCELFPCTATLEVDGLPLLASLDGLSMDETVVWENKLMNNDLLCRILDGDVPGAYWPQLEQGLLVTGAEKVYFTVSDGTEEGTVGMWYQPRPERRAKLIASWKQFAEDLKTYTPPEVIPAAVATPVKDLPALTVEITGSVIVSNLVQWKEIVTERIQAINTDLQTDQDFADADQMVKFLDDGEKRIDLVKAQAQSQAVSIDEAFRALDEIKAEMRAKRLELDKLVKARKESIRTEIANAGKDKLAEHVAALNKRLGKPYMPIITADFGAAIKGKRTITSLHDAVDTLLAQKKIEASEIADKIEINLNSLRELANDHTFLFADTAQIVLKANDDLVMLIKSRIAEHKAEEDRKMEAERARIRAEEEARAAAKVKAEQDEAAEKIKQDAALITSAPNAGAAAGGSQPVDESTEPASGTCTVQSSGQIPAMRVAPAPDNGKTLKLGDLNSLFGFTVTADFLESRGFRPVRVEKAARLYRQCDLPLICRSISQHLLGIAESYSIREAA